MCVCAELCCAECEGGSSHRTIQFVSKVYYFSPSPPPSPGEDPEGAISDSVVYFYVLYVNMIKIRLSPWDHMVHGGKVFETQCCFTIVYI